jgi:3-hydroxyisobutyrate dehydrogenase-like beta-hydroxyacid dehydrogenase
MGNASSIGFLHPGAMGVSLAASAIASGCRAVWFPAGRSDATRERADEHGLEACESLKAMCGSCDVIVSICPPAAADDVADQVIACGYKGTFVDANAVSPMRARAIAQRVNANGASYVDGSVIGGPAWTKDETVLYLSGLGADRVAGYFADGLLMVRVIGEEVDRASALKMCYAAFTKGSTAMLCAVIGAAHQLGVDEALRKQWAMDEPGSDDMRYNRVRRVTQKAWRFEGEMHEIAQTLASVGMPSGFHEAAAEVYARFAGLKGRDEMPELGEVLSRLGGA